VHQRTNSFEVQKENTVHFRDAFRILMGEENKTPGGEHCLDPPGAELLAWF